MSEVKTFIPQTPVEFSAGLISTLDASNESTASRVAKKDQLVQAEVAKTLRQLQAEKSQQLSDELQSKILAQEQDSKLVGSAELNAKLDKITQSLTQINASLVSKSPELVKVEEELTSCLINNKSKPLNCWDQIQAFKQLAKDI